MPHGLFNLIEMTNKWSWVHSWLRYYNRNHDTQLFCVLSLETRTQQNECFRMLKNERGYVCLGF
jgi:hypothetical protein